MSKETNALAYFPGIMSNWRKKSFVTFTFPVEHKQTIGVKAFLIFDNKNWGARYLTGENLKAVRTEFSTLSLAVLLQNEVNARHAHGHF